MKRFLIVLVGLLSVGAVFAEGGNGDGVADTLKRSLVIIDATIYSYDPVQPWRHTAVNKNSGYGVAVAEDMVLTTAYNVADASFITIRQFGKNELVPAKVAVVDYESNLALLKLAAEDGGAALTAVDFVESYSKGDSVEFYWLNDVGQVYNGRGYIDRAEMMNSPLSFAPFLNYIVGNISQRAGRGQLFVEGGKVIGISCWYNESVSEAGVIPAVTINHFLDDVADGSYDGFPMAGFATESLLDPAIRDYLKMPADLKDGVYISDVHTLGSGTDQIEKDDVVLAIDGQTLNAYGRYEDGMYGMLDYDHLITQKSVGDTIQLDVWRDGAKKTITVAAKTVKADEMLVPYYEYDKQSEFVVTGGYIFQKLTRKYMTAWGSDWAGRVHPHLVHYYLDAAFKPTDERQDIVVLTQVIPAEINLGYQGLRQIVLSTYNGMTIRSIGDILEAQKLNPESPYDVIELEGNNPTIVIPRKDLLRADMMIQQRYGVSQLQNIEK